MSSEKPLILSITPEFELHLLPNLYELAMELHTRSYRPGGSDCFVVEGAVKREVFASQFRDRVVHHLYCNYVMPEFDRLFVADSYSCRRGRGTSMGVRRLVHHAESCTRHYTREAWVMKLDISGYFMSIERERLYHTVVATLHRLRRRGRLKGAYDGDHSLLDFLLWLTDVIIHKDPLQGCRRKGDPANWRDIPPSKCLSCSPQGVGLPIGDLTSQLFSNVYLDALDQFVKRELKIAHYGRYVDDFYLMDTDRRRLLEARMRIAAFLKDIGLRLHPDKVVLQPCRHALKFLGTVARPHYTHCASRTVRRYLQALDAAERALRSPADNKNQTDSGNLTDSRTPTDRANYQKGNSIRAALASLQSYAGFLGHHRARRLLTPATPLLIHFSMTAK